MAYEFVGFMIVALVALAAASLANTKSRKLFPQRLLLAAVGLRIVGAVGRYEALERFYHGIGDASGYYLKGERLAAQIWSGEITPFSLWYWTEMMTVFGDRLWGTPFMIRLSGVVVSIIGPSIRAEFLFFALAAFVGLYWIARAMDQIQGAEQTVYFAAWMWMWPTLWFWPSSVGKEAVILFALGLATLGYTGDGRRIRWLPYAAGIGLAFLVRPHVAAVIGLATVIAHWLGSTRSWTPRRAAEGILLAIVAIVALDGMQTQFGFGQVDAEGVTEFVLTRAAMTDEGGSVIERAPLGILGIPLAIVNVWLRPFPWDAHNLPAALAAGEALVLWWLVWSRRRELVLAIRHWRTHRLLRFAGPFLAMYTIMIGVTFSNLGLISRQRTPLFPFLLLFVLAVPRLARTKVPQHQDQALTARSGPMPAARAET